MPACVRAECAVRALGVRRAGTRNAPCGRAECAVRARKPAGPVRPFLRFGFAKLVSNGATSLGRQDYRASPATPATQGACAELEPRGGRKFVSAPMC